MFQPLTVKTADVPRPFSDCHLESQADTEEWHLLLPGPLDGRDHAFRSTVTETTRHKDTPMNAC
jgi:hypothetical protein